MMMRLSRLNRSRNCWRRARRLQVCECCQGQIGHGERCHFDGFLLCEICARDHEAIGESVQVDAALNLLATGAL